LAFACRCDQRASFGTQNTFSARYSSGSSAAVASSAKSAWRDRRGEVLFIDARKLGVLVDRTRKEFSDEDIAKIGNTYHAWRGEKDAGDYVDVPGFCKAAKIEQILLHNHVLTPGRYVGAADVEDDDVPFQERVCGTQSETREAVCGGREANCSHPVEFGRSQS